MASAFDIAVRRIDGSADLLAPLRGKVLLAVNVASRCGYPPQYAGLEAEIAHFGRTSYNVSFPLSAKLSSPRPRTDRVEFREIPRQP